MQAGDRLFLSKFAIDPEIFIDLAIFYATAYVGQDICCFLAFFNPLNQRRLMVVVFS